MHPADVIAVKRDGHEHPPGQIAAWIDAYLLGSVAEEQMAAWLMAVTLRGMSETETAELTQAMLESGGRLGQRRSGRPRVDKHSTGGVGDKVSLLLAPLLAEFDLDVPMVSGRSLGLTGGTLDKLDSIPGFSTEFSIEEFDSLIAEHRCGIVSATADLAPADRRLYALRDLTGTVPSIPLITASIMSKKLAENLDALVLDVKLGGGTFMRELTEARALAASMVATGRRHGVATTALITEMEAPLGRAAGNAIEIDETVAVLAGEGPEDLIEVTLALGAELLVATGRSATVEMAQSALATRLADGSALRRFERMVSAQGGRLDADRPLAERTPVVAQRDGWVEHIDAGELGRWLVTLGAGRANRDDLIDAGVGIELAVERGMKVSAGDPLAEVFCRSADRQRSAECVQRAVTISGTQPAAPKTRIVDRVT